MPFATRADTGATVHPIWSKPDMGVLSAGRRPPPSMPAEPFGSLWQLVCDLAEGAGAPVDYVGLGAIVTAASLIGGKRRVRPWDTSEWSEPCILWGAVVGDPSSNKSPALDRATDALRLIEADHAGSHSNALSAWEADTERAKAERAQWQEAVKAATKDGLGTPPLPESAVAPDEPVRRRAMVQDATTEAMQAVLSGNPAGTLHLRDELAGWLQSFDRYTTGGRSFWLEAYGGRPFVVDRLKNGGRPVTIQFNGVSVLGGIQPEKLSEALLSGSDDGLVARFLWAWPERVPFSRPRRVADAWKLENVYRALDALDWGISEEGKRAPVTLQLEPGAADLYATWREASEGDGEDCGALYKGAVGKLPGTVLRLALVFELLRWASDGGSEPSSVSKWSVACALAYANDYAKPMALRVFGDAALPIVERNAATLARHIRKHGVTRLNAREARRTFGLPGLKEAQPMHDAIEWLVDADWLRPDPTRDGANTGRQRADYTVNPLALEGAQ